MGEDISVKAKIYTIGGFSAHAGQAELIEWVSKFITPKTKVFLVHGEELAQQELSALLHEKFNVDVHIPAYLEEQDVEPGEEPILIQPPAEAVQRVDWELLLNETQSKIALLQQKMEKMPQRPWHEQVEARDRVLELNSDLLTILTQL